ncbi:MAG: 3-phosphoglycerate dehydrogenase [Reyranella sp.]|uniref:2-hydroxyacid dehydrogenase n=1 Tax=Reyranella sp. TaxID=1929291 RepID=UPI001AD2524F|nr:NAD(P)-dependent oxidoreductase [Reyranella sp.]MBN9090172.1 3-phosphoglycerate dehydrogenase [Reyranella sp.]
MPKTLFIDSTPDIDKVWKRVHGANDIPVTVGMGPVDEPDVPAKIAGYDTVINDATYFSAPTLAKCAGLKHIVFLGTGAASFVDVAAAQKLGIKVSTISGYGDTTVAEHAMGLVFAAARHIATMHGIVRGGAWRPMQGMELRGKTLGIVGLGGIGREMARLGTGIGLNVLAYNRTAKPGTVPIDELLAQSDIVSLHLGLNDQTRGFLNRERIARTRPGVIVVNTARAGVVDEPALIAALKSGHVGHYATDVFGKEPPSPDEPLLRVDNVTLTSHAGYNTPEAAMTMYRRAIDLAAKG